MNEVIRGLRAWRGEAFPYVWVMEVQEHRAAVYGGTPLHVHLALPFFVDEEVMAALWGQGFVAGRRFRAGGDRVDLAESSRRAAGYLSKYVAKDLRTAATGEQSYRVAEGFSPPCVERRFSSFVDARAFLREHLGVVRWVPVRLIEWRGDLFTAAWWCGGSEPIGAGGPTAGAGGAPP